MDYCGAMIVPHPYQICHRQICFPLSIDMEKGDKSDGKAR